MHPSPLSAADDEKGKHSGKQTSRSTFTPLKSSSFNNFKDEELKVLLSLPSL